MKLFKKDAVLKHPGPVNFGVELEAAVLKDKRSRIFEQVTNGVFVREALMRAMLPEKK
jgi:aspartate carbamoyltransferase catalytic subunit